MRKHLRKITNVISVGTSLYDNIFFPRANSHVEARLKTKNSLAAHNEVFAIGRGHQRRIADVVAVQVFAVCLISAYDLAKVGPTDANSEALTTVPGSPFAAGQLSVSVATTSGPQPR